MDPISNPQPGITKPQLNQPPEDQIISRAEELLARGVGIPNAEIFQEQLEDDFMGAIKIKDGLFIGDEFSAQVSSI